MSKLCSYCGLCHDYENCDAQIINEQAAEIDWLNEKNKGLLSLIDQLSTHSEKGLEIIEQQAAEIELLKNKIAVLREGLQEVVNFFPTTLTGRPKIKLKSENEDCY
jgi:hypothetical protein